MRPLHTIPLLAACAALCVACGAQPTSGPGVAVAPPAGSTGAPPPADAPQDLGPDPDPRPGTATRALRLPVPDTADKIARVTLEVPASWGIRIRDAGGRALRPCTVSPSSPSELFIQARSTCDNAACPEHDKLADDLIRAHLISAQDIESQTAETKGPLVHITRLTGHLGQHAFSAFRYVSVEQTTLTPVACESFLFEDEITWLAAYERACATLRPAPEGFSDGPQELPPAPDGRPRSSVEEAAAQSALGYISALALRDPKTAVSYLLTQSECMASGGAQEECLDGDLARRADLAHGFEQIPAAFTASAVDVRFPSALSGLVIATVKRRGDPCGPGYEVTLARAQSRFAVVSAEPVPDPRLVQP